MLRELYIVGGTALTMNSSEEIIDNVGIYVKDGKIASLGRQMDLTIPVGAKTVDATKCLVLPGFVNGHTHMGMSLLRGLAEDLPLDRWLNDYIFPSEKKLLTPDYVYVATLLSCVEMIRSGTTTFNDMYYYEASVAKAAHEAGLRGNCGQTIIDTGHVKDIKSSICAELDRLLSEIASYELISPAVAPHSLYTVAESVWKELIRYVEKNDTCIHTHVSETEHEVEYSKREFGRRPCEYFESIGLWSQKVIAAHAVCLTKSDIELLAKYRVGVVHNAESNLKIGTKICQVPELREAGVAVAIGTDGAASNNDLDILAEADIVAKLQSYRKGAGALTAKDTVRLLTIEGARALRREQEIGSLEMGKAADIVCIDVNKPHAVPLHDPYSQLVYSSRGSDVKHSVVNGRVLLENYILTHLNENELMEEASMWGERIRKSLSH